VCLSKYPNTFQYIHLILISEFILETDTFLVIWGCFEPSFELSPVFNVYVLEQSDDSERVLSADV
jgi:hypothetical protein